MDVTEHTSKVGRQLIELKLPEEPAVPSIHGSRVSRLCENLSHIRVWEGSREGEFWHLEGGLESTGRSVTHLQYHSSGVNDDPRATEQTLDIMANNLNQLEKLVFDSRLIDPHAFVGLL